MSIFQKRPWTGVILSFQGLVLTLRSHQQFLLLNDIPLFVQSISGSGKLSLLISLMVLILN